MKIISFIFLGLAALSCNNKTVEFNSPTGYESITVIRKGSELLYVYPNDLENLNDKIYLKLDITHLEFGVDDQMYVCWQGNGNWKMAVPRSIILENKLDTNRCKFKTQLPEDIYGVPRITAFNKPNCFEFDIGRFKKITPRNLPNEE